MGGKLAFQELDVVRNVRFWHGADKIIGLKVRCERTAEVRNAYLLRCMLSNGEQVTINDLKKSYSNNSKSSNSQNVTITN